MKRTLYIFDCPSKLLVCVCVFTFSIVGTLIPTLNKITLYIIFRYILRLYGPKLSRGFIDILLVTHFILLIMTADAVTRRMVRPCQIFKSVWEKLRYLKSARRVDKFTRFPICTMLESGTIRLVRALTAIITDKKWVHGKTFLKLASEKRRVCPP